MHARTRQIMIDFGICLVLWFHVRGSTQAMQNFCSFSAVPTHRVASGRSRVKLTTSILPPGLMFILCFLVGDVVAAADIENIVD